jgi:hypothetical protein
MGKIVQYERLIYLDLVYVDGSLLLTFGEQILYIHIEVLICISQYFVMLLVYG